MIAGSVSTLFRKRLIIILKIYNKNTDKPSDIFTMTAIFELTGKTRKYFFIQINATDENFLYTLMCSAQHGVSNNEKKKYIIKLYDTYAHTNREWITTLVVLLLETNTIFCSIKPL